MEEFPPTTLYLDDLSEIINILTKACERVNVRAGEYKITDISEIEELASKFPAGRFEDVYLQGDKPYITVNLLTYGVSAYASIDTFENRGIISNVRDIVNRGKKINPALFYNSLSYIPILLCIWEFMSKEYVFGTWLIFLSIQAIFIAVKYSMKNKVIIYSRPRSQVKTFFERKKDDIVLAIISAIFGGFVAYIITKLTA